MSGQRGKSVSRRALPAAHGPKTAANDAPSSLGAALSQLFALKGYAATKGDARLTDAWNAVAGEKIAAMTKVQGIHRGVLQVAVASSAMLGELASFHKLRLVEELKTRHPALKVQDVKFRLRGDLARP
jgi:predicted nucleic acid-binding Zn ribbon protein